MAAWKPSGVRVENGTGGSRQPKEKKQQNDLLDITISWIGKGVSHKKNHPKGREKS